VRLTSYGGADPPEERLRKRRYLRTGVHLEFMAIARAIVKEHAGNAAIISRALRA